MFSTFRFALWSNLAVAAIASTVHAGDPFSLDADVNYKLIQPPANALDAEDSRELDRQVQSMEARLRELRKLERETIMQLNGLREMRDRADSHFLQRAHIDLTGLPLSAEDIKSLLKSASTSKERRSLAIQSWFETRK